MAIPELICTYAPAELAEDDIIRQCSVCGKDVVVHPPGQEILEVNSSLTIYCHPCSEAAFLDPPVIPPELTGAVS